jgi:excisionase family DNA binding protein
MSANPKYESEEITFEVFAADIARLIKARLGDKDITQLLGVVFLDTPEVAALLRVKPGTVEQWVSDNKIPYRKARGHTIFMLAEVISWTLPTSPDADPHCDHRLTLPRGVKLAASSLAAIGERKK